MKFTLTNKNICKDLAIGSQKEVIMITEFEGRLLIQNLDGEILAVLELDAIEDENSNSVPGAYFLSFTGKNGNSVGSNYASIANYTKDKK